MIEMSDIRKYFTAGSKRPNKQFSLPGPSGPLSKEDVESSNARNNTEFAVHFFPLEDGCYGHTVVAVDDVIHLL